MKRFILEKSNANIVSHAGLSLLGLAVNKYTTLTQAVDHQVPLRHGIHHSDILKSYLGLVSIGKNDFEAINTIECNDYFCHALGLMDIPSEATLRQRMDKHAKAFGPIVEKANIDFLANIQPDLKPLSDFSISHIPLDADVTPLDNSGSKKEGVSRTYKGHDGYAPMAAYLGQEGYCLEFELREGRQHCQKGTPVFLERLLTKVRRITPLPILLRLDGGNDSIENIDTVLEHNATAEEGQLPVDFIIKWNPRQEDRQQWMIHADKEGLWTHPRDGKRVAVFDIEHRRVWKGYQYPVRRVMRVIERTIDKQGQHLLEPEVELEGWWTSLCLAEGTIIDLYSDHGTSEQFHSEFKTDLDIERLPSGKFATNALVLAVSTLAYNLLRWIGQNGLLGPFSVKRKKAKRRRIKTVMQELIYLAVRVVRSARRYRLSFGQGCRSFRAFEHLYEKLAAG